MFFIRRACLTFPANASTRQSIALLRHSRPTRRRPPVGVRKSCRLAEPLRLTAFGTSPFRGGFVPEGAPRTLFERVSVAEGLKPFVNDYRVNVFEIPRLTAEQVGQFKSDFRIVADYFVQMGRDEDYVPPRQTIEHVDAVLKPDTNKPDNNKPGGDNKPGDGNKPGDNNPGDNKPGDGNKPGEGRKGSSGGGCDAGVGGLALALGAAFLLRRKV